MNERDLKRLVDKQAKDDGLWFVAHYATEAYLQQALRELHEAIEKFYESKKIRMWKSE